MIYSLLNSIQNVISLTATEKDIIASLWKGKTYKKGDLFLAEGQVCRQVGFITKGLIRYYINHNGEDKTYAFAKEGDFICNYESFIPQTPSQKNIQALEDCEILQISHDLDMVSRFCDQVICLNRSIVCQGVPNATLSTENLMAAYGPHFTRYHHHH